MKDIEVTEIRKEINFKGVSGKIEPEKSFQRKPVTKYLRLTLVLCEVARYGTTLIF